MKIQNVGKSALAAAVVLAVLILAAAGSRTEAQAGAGEGSAVPSAPVSPEISSAVHYDASPPLAFLPPLAAEPGRAPLPVRPLLGRAAAAAAAAPQPDPVLQTAPGQAAMPAPFLTFEGVSNVDQVLPPDTIGDVGPDHYVQMVNISFAIWDKAGARLYGPAGINTLWQGFGGPCQTSNDGDPVVLYDQLADRWLMSQFALPNFPEGPFYQCIAISTTGNPTGAWYRYAFLYHPTKLNDYPKFGVWPDGYYMTANQFFFTPNEEWAGQGVVVFERDKMLSGQPARMIYFDLFATDPRLGGMLPADLDGVLPPPAGTPNFLVQISDDDQGDPADRLQIWQLAVDWANPANTTLAPAQTPLAVAPFDGLICATRSCLPQPGVGGESYLDAISDRLMYRAAYRNFGDSQALALNHTVAAGSARAGIRWYELRRQQGDWSIQQQGTYAPDSTSRWMGSVAMDAGGNLALGYSAASTTVYPSIRYAGRLADDPAGVLAQAEVTMQPGAGSQLSIYGRWGDYSLMTVDPTDDCTFWYTQQYYQTTSVQNWQTRVGAFRFPGCISSPAGGVQGRVTNASTGAPVARAHLQLGAFSAETDADGRYRFLRVPAGSQTLSVSAYGFGPVNLSLVVPNGGALGQDVGLTPLPSLTLSGVVSDGGGQGWPLYARVEIAGYPNGPIFTNPATGEYRLDLFIGQSYSLVVSAVNGGYVPASRSFTLAEATRVQNFALLPDQADCSAPGYRPRFALRESFEANNGGFYEVEVAPSSWEWGVPSSGPGSAHSGTKLWATNLSGSYGNGEDGYLVSPPIDLRSFQGSPMTVAWWQWLETESGFDTATVEVSKDGGVSWTRVLGPVSGRVDSSWRQYTAQLDASFAVSNFKIAFNLRSDGSVTLPGYYVDDIAIYGGCDPEAGGLVVGHVLDANLNTGLNGARVSHAGGSSTTTVATPADLSLPDGYYQLFAPAGSAAMTATMASGYGPLVERPTVMAGGVVRQDFRLPAGRLAFQPDRLTVAVEWGTTATASLLLKNEGGRQVEWEASIRPPAMAAVRAQSVAPAAIKTRPSSHPFDRGPVGTVGQAGEPAGGWAVADRPELAANGWALLDPFPGGRSYRAATTTCDGENLFVFGGADESSTRGDAWRYDAVQNLWTRLADMPLALMNMNASCIDDVIYLVGGYSIASDAQTNAFQIYDVATDVWQLSTWPVVDTPISAALDGNLYAFGGSSGGEVWRYDPATAEWSLLPGQMPVAVGYAGVTVFDDYIFVLGGGVAGQGLTATVQRYHPATNTWDASGPPLPNARMSANAFSYGERIYVAGGGGRGGAPWTAFGDTWAFEPALWPGGAWVNQDHALVYPVVAAASVCVANRLHAVGGIDEVDLGDIRFYDVNQFLDLGLPCHSASAGPPWLGVAPVSGSLPAHAQASLTLSFDAALSQIPEPGVYRAALRVKEDSPYSSPSLPVTMTVTPPPTYGLLQGSLRGLGYCDAAPSPLPEAVVQVTSATGVIREAMSDANGAFHFWLPAAESPYSLVAGHGLHDFAFASGIIITGQTTTPLALDLRLLQTCLTLAPASIEATMAVGERLTLPVTLTNTGAETLSYRLLEKEPASAPSIPPQGGPDLFGYTWRDNRIQGGPHYQWVEIAPPAGGAGAEITQLTGKDDAYFWPVELPFAFPFYGQDYRQLAVSSNGLLYFEDRAVTFDNSPIPGPTLDGLLTFIAPLWDDLVVGPGAIYTLAEADRLIIEYYQLQAFNAPQPGSWQAILFANGNILFQYQDVVFGSSNNYGGSATVGIQGDAEAGLSFGFNAPRLTNGLAICFAYPGENERCQEYSDVDWLSATPDVGLVDPGGTAVAQVAIESGDSPADLAAHLILLSNDPQRGRRVLPVQVSVVAPTPTITDVRVANLTDAAATISWLTDVVADGSIVFGADVNHVHRTAADVRGEGVRDDAHFVTLAGLTPNTTYYFAVRSGPTQADNGGAFFRFKTGPTLTPPATDAAFGRVLQTGGGPAAGALVFLSLQDANGQGSSGRSAALSALTDANGYWSVNLGNARVSNLVRYFGYSAPGDRLQLEVRAGRDGVACPAAIDAAAARPAPDLLLGSDGDCAHIVQLTLKRGWSFIALPLAPPAPLTAAGFCTQANQQGGALVEVDRWHQAGWDGHVCAAAGNDFGLALGGGYFVRNNTASVWNLTGEPVTQPVSLTLNSGWNAISIPHTGAYTAASLCDEIISQGAPAVEIDRWLDSGWSGHICGLPFGDFALERHQGYFLRVNGSWVITPQAPPDADEVVQAAAAAAPPAAIPAEAVAVSNLQLANLREGSATLSWLSEQPATGFVEYGETPALGSFGVDARGYDIVSRTHFVTVAGLKPDTTYFYRIVSGGDGGPAAPPASFRTIPALAAPPAPDTIYGRVFAADGVTPAAGAILHLTLQDADGEGAAGQSLPLAALVDADGYWFANLGNARQRADGRAFVYSAAGDRLAVAAQGEQGLIYAGFDTAALRPAASLSFAGRPSFYLPWVMR